MKNKFKIQTKVWRWPGDGGWYFANVDKDLSAKIRSVYTKGFVKIVAKVGKTTWDTSLFPHKLSKAYLISIKKSVRLKEGILEGDIVQISFTIK